MEKIYCANRLLCPGEFWKISFVGFRLDIKNYSSWKVWGRVDYAVFGLSIAIAYDGDVQSNLARALIVK